jgi:hypothetical protein
MVAADRQTDAVVCARAGKRSKTGDLLGDWGSPGANGTRSLEEAPGENAALRALPEVRLAAWLIENV